MNGSPSAAQLVVGGVGVEQHGARHAHDVGAPPHQRELVQAGLQRGDRLDQQVDAVRRRTGPRPADTSQQLGVDGGDDQVGAVVDGRGQQARRRSPGRRRAAAARGARRAPGTARPRPGRCRPRRDSACPARLLQHGDGRGATGAGDEDRAQRGRVGSVIDSLRGELTRTLSRGAPSAAARGRLDLGEVGAGRRCGAARRPSGSPRTARRSGRWRPGAAPSSAHWRAPVRARGRLRPFCESNSCSSSTLRRQRLSMLTNWVGRKSLVADGDW